MLRGVREKLIKRENVQVTLEGATKGPNFIRQRGASRHHPRPYFMGAAFIVIGLLLVAVILFATEKISVDLVTL
jgi:hypothetical protein